MLETLKLSKTLKSSRDDFNVLDTFNVSSMKTAINKIRGPRCSVQCFTTNKTTALCVPCMKLFFYRCILLFCARKHGSPYPRIFVSKTLREKWLHVIHLTIIGLKNIARSLTHGGIRWVRHDNFHKRYHCSWALSGTLVKYSLPVVLLQIMTSSSEKSFLKQYGPVVSTRSIPNRGFTQAMGLRDSL